MYFFGVKKIFTCPYSPQSDAICERYNRTLTNMLGTLDKEKRGRWSKYILHMCNIYNSSAHSATGFSPFELMFGRKSRLPVDLLLSTTPSDNEYGNLREYVKALKSRLEFVHEVARRSMEINHLRNKDRYDEKSPGITCEPGDRVLVKNVGVKGMHKLEPNWLPHEYIVIRQVEGNPRVYEIKSVSNPRKKPRILHIDMLKKVTDLAFRHQKNRQFHDVTEYARDSARLFDEEEGTGDNATKTAVPATKVGQRMSDVNHPPIRRARYPLRSQGKVNASQDRLDDQFEQSTETDSERSDESFSDDVPNILLTFEQPQHASELTDTLDYASSGDSQDGNMPEQDEEVLPHVLVEDDDATTDDLPISSDGDDLQQVDEGDLPVPFDEHEQLEEDVTLDDGVMPDLDVADNDDTQEIRQQESADDDSTGSIAEEPPGVGRRLPTRNRRPPDRFGNLVLQCLGIHRPSPPTGPPVNGYLIGTWK